MSANVSARNVTFSMLRSVNISSHTIDYIEDYPFTFDLKLYTTVSTSFNFSNIYNMSERAPVNNSSSESVFESQIIIPLYVIIFLLAVVGNSVVLATLVRNKRMRTVTNVYLLNLAVSDLLLGVFCMPFTLVGQVLRNFIFGSIMCKLIPYFQAVSVSVGVWTLVAISLERYFAICRPLKSRRWQTQFHAYKMIGVVWLASLGWSAPVLLVSSLKAMTKGRGHKCREEWPSQSSEQAYNLFLDAILLLVPLIIMSLAYSLIMSKLWKGLKREIQHNTSCQRQMLDRSYTSQISQDTLGKNNNASPNSDNNGVGNVRQHQLAPPSTVRVVASTKKSFNNKTSDKTNKKTETVKLWLMKGIVQVKLPNSDLNGYQGYTRPKGTVLPRCELTTPSSERNSYNGQCNSEDLSNTPSLDETTYHFNRHAIRSNYMDRSIEAKKKVIRMLFVVVAEFFICWAPLHILNTWYLFYPEDVYLYVGSTGISLVQLLAYISSCCNPITYCFMNRKFRQAFLSLFNWQSICCYCCECVESNNTKLVVKNGVQLNYNHKVVQNNSDISGNDSTVYVGRASTIGRSEIVVLDAEDRV